MCYTINEEVWEAIQLARFVFQKSLTGECGYNLRKSVVDNVKDKIRSSRTTTSPEHYYTFQESYIDGKYIRQA